MNRTNSESNDVFGQALRNYWVAGEDRPIEVYMNGSRQEDLIPSYFFRGYNQMRSYERLALRRAGTKVLDVGAGGGAHSVLLQNRGLEVTAIDISPGACEVLRERGVKRVVHGEVQKCRDTDFDTILLLMNGIGISGDAQGARKLLRKLATMLRPGGEILCDSTDITYHAIQSGIPLVSDRYYGEVVYQMKYKGKRGDAFAWFYADAALLAELAQKEGLSTEVIHRDKEAHFLVSLKK